MSIVIIVVAMMSSCDVHEWPREDEGVPFVLQLQFTTDWDEQDHFFTRSTRAGEKGTMTRGETRSDIESRALGEYDMRYIVRAYPIDAEGSTASEHSHEFVFSKAVITDFDYSTTEVSLPEGDYQLMVWADFVVPGTTDNMHYEPTDFSGINLLTDPYTGNTDYRDAFRGTTQIALQATVYEEEPVSVTIPMERPMAKFTFVTTDLREFIEREATRNNRNNRNNRNTKEADTKDADTKDSDTKNPDTKDPEKDDEQTISLSDYRVVFYYTGFLPSSYNMFIDKPVDSVNGVNFPSTLTQLNDDEATMGFDYVMVNGSDAAVMVTVGLFDADDTPVSMSDEIKVPLNRSVNTIVRGSFLMQEANGGIGIDPSFENDHNIFIP